LITPGRTRNHGDTEMKPELDDKAARKETGLLVYNARLFGVLLVLGFVNILLIVAAARMAYFPTDLPIARGLQSLAPLSLSWASSITATADKPWCFVLLALTVMVAWLLRGWSAALVALPVFFGLWLFGIWLSPLIAQPRPSPELIQVIGHPKGYAFPSIFGLVYAATFGYLGLLAGTQCRGAVRLLIPLVAVSALLIGACARIVLGAHWPSDLWVAYLLGLFWIAALLPFSSRKSEPL
jgi:membrane-associated phospholipid phosphatase